MHTHLRTFALGAMVILATRCTLAQSCPGDLDGDHRVTINEIIIAVNAALDGCPASGDRFIENGDGTITDTQTRLVWEKKSDDGSVSMHDKDNRYTWSSTGTEPDGTVFTEFLPTLNGQAFAGETDWRLPTRQELEGILDRRFASQIDPVFSDSCNAGCTVLECSCSALLSYWTSTTDAADPRNGWHVDFNIGGGNNFAPKTTPLGVRAVRRGL